MTNIVTVPLARPDNPLLIFLSFKFLTEIWKFPVIKKKQAYDSARSFWAHLIEHFLVLHSKDKLTQVA